VATRSTTEFTARVLNRGLASARIEHRGDLAGVIAPPRIGHQCTRKNRCRDHHDAEQPQATETTYSPRMVMSRPPARPRGADDAGQDGDALSRPARWRPFPWVPAWTRTSRRRPAAERSRSLQIEQASRIDGSVKTTLAICRATAIATPTMINRSTPTAWPGSGTRPSPELPGWRDRPGPAHLLRWGAERLQVDREEAVCE